MKIAFLGTGTSTGVPVVACKCKVCSSDDPRDKRYRTSVMLTRGNSNIVIDCGPDFRIQMLKHKVEDIDAVVFTHAHRDHIAGLDDLRAFNYILHKSIDIYGTQDTLDTIKEQFPYIFIPGQYLGAPKLKLFTITETPFSIGEFDFLPIQVMHQELKVFGYRIADFTYITDANYISPVEMEKIRGSKVVVINALRIKPHVSHFSLSEALEIIEELKPEKAYLTHISHFLGKFEEVEPNLPDGVHLAYDGLQIEL
ncbi:MAG: MBL fold metallo-hydrolase [Lentimicrobiaceae bacterium]|jgi:phosphoribosyl 1,2-cyclic phosphate phosphodiesterase